MKAIKLLASGLILSLSLEELIAKRMHRSLSGQLVNQILPAVRAVPSIDTTVEYEQAARKSMNQYRVPRIIKHRYRIHQYRGHEDILEVIPRQIEFSHRVVFYIHGGGYWGQPFPQHYQIVANLANQLGRRVIMPIYPKAPAYDANDAFTMVLKSYQMVVNSDANDIVLMGDSAGGGLVLSLMQHLKRNQGIQPSCAVLLSPWLDISNTNPQMRLIQPKDPVLDLDNLTRLGAIYANRLSVKDPLVSPLYGDSSSLPPILVITGTDDILYPDAMKFQQLAVRKRWDVTTTVYRAMNHDFAIFPITEAQKALNETIEFIKNND
ncbi:alpha/beta hydrolase fold domain-containing protein [Lactobacillus sp. Sy-1]|uniref:alpha/beta hydrolase fold domain-containing protein n=1 Tax=Lactobacillus sp. Sy-1 TaxID=2109645 RepID=UPI001C5BCE8F|nr:alpha/beta hydrolase [Lactobacillus sp. Sy-1]MBW1606390.1 alpha/beta hydrolase [Lactobacillus sp. Sy-1]